MIKSIMFFASSILLLSCSNDSNNVVPKSGAIFKIEYLQTGNFESYKKEIGFSETLILEGSEVEAGPILLDADLSKEKYVFVSKKKIDLLKLTFVAEPKESLAHGEMTEFVLNVYRDDQRIDTKSFKISGGGKMSHSWEYKSK